MSKRDFNLVRRIKELGNVFSEKTMSGEKVGYCLINTSYDIEISGIHNNKQDRNITGVIYVYFKKNLLVEKLPFNSFDEAKMILNKILEHYDVNYLGLKKPKYGHFDYYNEAQRVYYI